MIFSSSQIPEAPEALRRDGADGEPTLRPGPGGAGAGAGHLARVQPPLKVSCQKAVRKLSQPPLKVRDHPTNTFNDLLIQLNERTFNCNFISERDVRSLGRVR